MLATTDSDVDADVERMLGIHRNRKTLGWDYYDLTNRDRGERISDAERQRQSRARRAAK